MQPVTQEQFNQLQRQYFELAAKFERLDEAEKKRDFTIRDSAIKIGISEGLAKSNHEAISKLELKLVEVQASVKELRETCSQQFEGIHGKLDKQSELLMQVLAKLQ